jgi:RES domain-containing protein
MEDRGWIAVVGFRVRYPQFSILNPCAPPARIRRSRLRLFLLDAKLAIARQSLYKKGLFMPTPHPMFGKWYAQLNGPSALARITWSGDVFRATLPKWMSRPYRLTGVGSVLSGGRWNVKSLVPVMNFGTTAAVTAAEADAKAIRNGWPPGSLSPQTRVAFHLQLQSVLDFTNAAALRALGIKKTELTGCDWEAEQTAGREALTQALAAFETYAEGLIVPSARLKGGVNVVVFPAHLMSGSTIAAQDEANIPFMHGL